MHINQLYRTNQFQSRLETIYFIRVWLQSIKVAIELRNILNNCSEKLMKSFCEIYI